MDWGIIEVVIGLSFLFFLLSIVASALNEAIAGLFNLRAKTLEKGIANLLTGTADPGLPIVKDFFANHLVGGYSVEGKPPSYLSSRSFRNVLLTVTGLLDKTGEPSADAERLETIRADIEAKISGLEPHLRDSLMTLWQSANRDATEFRAAVERWFDRAMERVTGWYKRRAQLILFIVGVIVAIAINASALNAANRLWKDGELRRGLIAAVENQQQPTDAQAALKRLEQLEFPVGWDAANRPSTGGGWAVAALGWLLTGLAVTLGAPFWFDVLGKVSNLRAAGIKPTSVLTPAPTEASVSTVKLEIANPSP
jgi:hypothetical protein